MNRNSLLLGLISGAIVPLLGILIFYVIKYLPENLSLSDFIFMLKTNHYTIPKIISLGMIAYIPLITYYKNRRQHTTLKGIFIMIGVYALLAVFYKFNIL